MSFYQTAHFLGVCTLLEQPPLIVVAAYSFRYFRAFLAMCTEWPKTSPSGVTDPLNQCIAIHSHENFLWIVDELMRLERSF